MLSRHKKEYSYLISSIGAILEQGRKQAYLAVNNILVKTYWDIGKRIAEYELSSGEDTRYGSKLFERIATDLRLKHGKGFSRSNVIYMRLLYKKYPKSQTLSDQLTWSHYIELLTIEEDLERNFYENQCINERWAIRELRRQIDSALYHRIALSMDKKGVMQLSKKGRAIAKAKDLVKEPFILEFLGIPEDYKYTEKELEQKIIDNLQMFILELGKGFSFIARQYNITIENHHFYVDLVFYHRILRCFVLIDLKIGKVDYRDVGQMNLYLNYFKKEENSRTDNEPIGIILGTDKDKIIIEYALGGMTNKVFVSKYKLYLPDKNELKSKLKMILENN